MTRLSLYALPLLVGCGGAVAQVDDAGTDATTLEAGECAASEQTKLEAGTLDALEADPTDAHRVDSAARETGPADACAPALVEDDGSLTTAPACPEGWRPICMERPVEWCCWCVALDGGG